MQRVTAAISSLPAPAPAPARAYRMRPARHIDVEWHREKRCGDLTEASAGQDGGHLCVEEQRIKSGLPGSCAQLFRTRVHLRAPSVTS